MVEKQVEVKLKTGLQARPAALRAAGAGQQGTAARHHRGGTGAYGASPHHPRGGARHRARPCA